MKKNTKFIQQHKIREKREKGKKNKRKTLTLRWSEHDQVPPIVRPSSISSYIYLPNASKMCDDMMSETYLRTGLDRAIGVATPNALIRCCIVGVADVIRIAAPG